MIVYVATCITEVTCRYAPVPVNFTNLEGLKHEDEGNEDGETLLCEARDVGDERRQVKRDDDHEKDEHPGAHPEAEAEERQLILAERITSCHITIWLFKKA